MRVISAGVGVVLHLETVFTHPKLFSKAKASERPRHTSVRSLLRVDNACEPAWPGFKRSPYISERIVARRARRVRLSLDLPAVGNRHHQSVSREARGPRSKEIR